MKFSDAAINLCGLIIKSEYNTRSLTKKNNVLALEFNEYGILAKKDFYNKNQINKINFTEATTDTITRERNFVYSFLSSLRTKINKPKHLTV